MKLVIAINRPERLEAVEEALRAVLDEGAAYRLSADEVLGHGRQSGEVELFRGQEVHVRGVERTRVTIGVNDAYLEKTVDAIVKAARIGTGQVGDGKVFVLPLEDAVRIRTGERGGRSI